MDKQQARKCIKETFENPFDKERFIGFIKNLLNRIGEAPFTYQGKFIPEAYRQYISTLERIGKFNDGENRIDILIVRLQKKTSLERARTMQRNFIAWYLNGSRGGELKDAALVAFVSPDDEDWRFSLVKMDYKFEQTKTGRMRVKEEFTPARRWSFLVGENEKSHTAQSRLVNILADDEHSPTFDKLEQAFDIETVTREFFREYRDLFIRTKEALDKVVKNDAKVKADFEAKGVNSVDFAKKLLGQIVFLYFLQKKGWFGVSRDEAWGTGSKHFLRACLCRERGRQAAHRQAVIICPPKPRRRRVRISLMISWNRFFMMPCGTTAAMMITITSGLNAKSRFSTAVSLTPSAITTGCIPISVCRTACSLIKIKPGKVMRVMAFWISLTATTLPSEKTSHWKRKLPLTRNCWARRMKNSMPSVLTTLRNIKRH
ncbi:MAG: hypothetical protein MRJ65_13285 [Candidatus Brocadiaceae bacterium]|nr:hypothetical protein [Candidatus Brocadiaceae bacterium]